jgi:hypothetical protein
VVWEQTVSDFSAYIAPDEALRIQSNLNAGASLGLVKQQKGILGEEGPRERVKTPRSLASIFHDG